MSVPVKTLLLQRKYEQEAGAIGISLVYFHFTMQSFGNDAADIQSQSRALLEFIQLSEALEDTVHLVCRDAAAGICYGECHLAGILGNRAMEMDFAFFRILFRIGEEVDKHLLHTLTVGDDLVIVRDIRRVIELHFLRFTMCNGRKYKLAHLVAIMRSHVHGIIAALQGGKVENVIHQRSEQFGVVLYQRAEFFFLFVLQWHIGVG